MLTNIPQWIPLMFMVTTILTLSFFAKAIPNSKSKTAVLSGILVWLGLQSALAYWGFYLNFEGIPPRFVLTFGPTLVLMLVVFNLKKSKAWIDTLSTKTLTLLHIIRVPVEIVLMALAIEGVVPEMMTFEGTNLDILSGITALFIYYFGYVKQKLSKYFLVIWNTLALALLVNVVATAILSAPTEFQLLNHNESLTAIMNFPFVLLPAVVVPIVFFSHFVCIRDLVKR
ncbi:MAG: hypothetical protein ACJAZ3_000494 [Sphingobacteriales bacterium]|jgi:hypothetical protein